jgi:hypothetical protein
MLSAASQRDNRARFVGGFLSLPAIWLAPLILNAMPQRDFVIWLDGGMYIAVDFATSGPTMLSFVVRLVFTDDSGQHTIARYDTAHGTAHRDLVSPRDRLVEKRWLIDLDFPEALEYAVRDFKTNYARYLEIWRKAQGLL